MVFSNNLFTQPHIIVISTVVLTVGTVLCYKYLTNDDRTTSNQSKKNDKHRDIAGTSTRRADVKKPAEEHANTSDVTPEPVSADVKTPAPVTKEPEAEIQQQPSACPTEQETYPTTEKEQQQAAEDTSNTVLQVTSTVTVAEEAVSEMLVTDNEQPAGAVPELMEVDTVVTEEHDAVAEATVVKESQADMEEGSESQAREADAIQTATPDPLPTTVASDAVEESSQDQLTADTVEQMDIDADQETQNDAVVEPEVQDAQADLAVSPPLTVEAAAPVPSEVPCKTDSVSLPSPVPVTSSSTTSSSSSLAKQSDQESNDQAINFAPPEAVESTSPSKKSTQPSGLAPSYWRQAMGEPLPQYSMGWPELLPIQSNVRTQKHQQDTKQQGTSLYSVDAGDAVAATTAPMANQRESGEGKKRRTKKRMTRAELIEQQRQPYIPRMKGRCDYWPNCTNKNCKFRHPIMPCRAGDDCEFGNRCMFLHPRDYNE